MNTEVTFTRAEIESATYNELRKMAKQANVTVVKNATAIQYRLTLIATSLRHEVAKPKGLATLQDVTVGDTYTVGKGKVTYSVLSVDTTGVQVKNEKGQTWWERKLDKSINISK